MRATVIYPHQLFAPAAHPALARDRVVYLVEEPLLFTYNPIHRQRLLLHRLSLHAYQAELEAAGYTVRYIALPHDSARVFAQLVEEGVTAIDVVDTTDHYLEAAITAAAHRYDMRLQRYDSPLFLLPKTEACERYHASRRFMAKFYQQLRRDYAILLTDQGKPLGGRWSFDADNRHKLPRSLTLPADITWQNGPSIDAALQWLDTLPSVTCYGTAQVWLPYTRVGAQAALDHFLSERFAHFGRYEDALSRDHVRLFHSALSPLLNIGLLTPRQVLDAALAYGHEHQIPINSLEGFVRQLLGWREFIRAAYEVDGVTLRTRNFWQHTRPLPTTLWTGETGLWPVDHCIQTALRYGYTHHIERLMVLGNFMLLTRSNPDAVYNWFMGLYVDAYDWVMVPNVYGMSQFADGGLFATKPYISGSNYLKKMSNYPGGDWETLWTSLYWHFIATHRDLFLNNHRLSMMPRLWDKMDAAKRAQHQSHAEAFLREFSEVPEHY